MKPSFIKNDFISLAALLLAIISAGYFYTVFPDHVPIHWNLAGVPDGWASKSFGVLLVPVIMIGIYTLLSLVVRTDPYQKNSAEFREDLARVKGVLLAAMLAVYWALGGNILGYPVRIEVAVPIIIGILFFSIGTYVKKVKMNWFMGVRTPWTLSSPEVWRKTNRLGGQLFMVGGALFILLPFFPGWLQIAAIIAIIVLVAFVPITYSFWLYKTAEKN